MGTPETQMFTIAESSTSLIRVVCQSATVRLQAFTSEGMKEIVLQEDAVKALQHILQHWIDALNDSETASPSLFHLGRSR